MYLHAVVGAGSAGCVLAARLSEDPGVKGTLIEAGGDAIDLPGQHGEKPAALIREDS